MVIMTYANGVGTSATCTDRDTYRSAFPPLQISRNNPDQPRLGPDDRPQHINQALGMVGVELFH